MRTIAEIVVGVIGTLSALAGWVSVALASGVSGGNWGAPLIWFSGTVICFLLGAMLYRERRIQLAFASALVVPSIAFAVSFFHALLVVLAVWLLVSGMRRIQEDMALRLKMAFRKSMQVGVFSFSLAVSLLIASEYYTHIRNSAWEDLVPRFSLGEGGGDVVLRVVGWAYPELGKIRNQGVTVDGFLEATREQNGSSGILSSAPFDPALSLGGSASVEKELSLAVGRLEIGALVGRAVEGDEKMSDVLSEAIRNKTLAFIAGEKAERNLPSGVVPFVLSLLLFLTVLSLASLLHFLWVAAAAFVMRMLLRSEIVGVNRIAVEQEVLR